MNADCTVQAPATHRIRHPIALRLQCRKEWVEGQGTLAQIAKRHGVPESTVIAWYRRDNWTASRNRWLAKQLSDNEPPPSPPSYAPNPKNTTSAHAEMLQRLELQLSALDNFLDNAKTPADFQKLTTAKSRLLEHYYILAGIHKPGSRKPAKERLQSPRLELPDIAPLGLAPKPVLNPAA
jgi:transposase-like protein